MLPMPAFSRDLRRVLLGCACLTHFAGGFGLLLSSPLQQLPSPTSSPLLERPNCDPIDAQNLLVVSDDDANHSRNCGYNPWATARKALQDPGCCVISVCSPGDNKNNSNRNGIDNENESNALNTNLSVLQERLADRGPSDIDIRARIDTSTVESAIKDCLEICRLMVDETTSGERTKNDNDRDDLVPSAKALAEFAMGMASFADDCGCSSSSSNKNNNDNDNNGSGVFLRFVCASSYRAHDPVFHTDKAPLRGYSTLRGVGTEFVTHPCSPLEYLALRSLGTKLPGRGNQHQNQQGESQTLRCASEREFIIMKGDYYYRRNSKTAAAASSSAAASSWWQRAFACVHRSPPGTTRGGRRVILSFDLADGDDDREWHDVHQKRKWRAGMTQRKSKLVS